MQFNPEDDLGWSEVPAGRHLDKFVAFMLGWRTKDKTYTHPDGTEETLKDVWHDPDGKDYPPFSYTDIYPFPCYSTDTSTELRSPVRGFLFEPVVTDFDDGRVVEMGIGVTLDCQIHVFHGTGNTERLALVRAWIRMVAYVLYKEEI